MMTIVGLAQNFVGSNNLNLLQPLGQFGTRLNGGKDSASPRYIFTMLRSAEIDAHRSTVGKAASCIYIYYGHYVEKRHIKSYKSVFK